MHSHQVFGQILADVAEDKMAAAKTTAHSTIDGESVLEEIRKEARKYPPQSGGSWNIPLLAMAVEHLVLDDPSASGRLINYCKNQLTGDPGLWGEEILSRLYWDPPAVLALLAEKEPPGTQLAQAVLELVRAHLLTLALFALPKKYDPSEGGGDFPVVWNPGIRCTEGTAPNLGLSYLFARAAGRTVKIPVSSTPPWAWPYRLVAALGFGFLDSTFRDRPRRHQEQGREAGEIVAELQKLGVHMAVPVKVWRYASGDLAATIHRNTHSTKPPILGTSSVSGELRFLLCPEAHPWICQRQGNLIEASLDPPKVKAPAPLPAPSENQELLYQVVIQQNGVRRVGDQNAGRGQKPTPMVRKST